MRWKKRLRINRETNIKLHVAFGLEIPHTDITSLYFGKLFPYSHTTGRKNSRGDVKRFSQEHGQAAENPGLEVQILWPKSSVPPTKLNCFPLKTVISILHNLPWGPTFSPSCSEGKLADEESPWERPKESCTSDLHPDPMFWPPKRCHSSETVK